MGQAAAPHYLGNDFSKAAPGHRFSLYLPLWVKGPWTREPDKQANPKDGLPATGKAPALRTVLALGDYFADMNRKLCERQSALAAPLAAQGQLLTLHAIAVAPFTTGLGNEHPLENGFAFLNPYGLPYLAGSGVKGVLRQAARELADHQWGDDHGWTIDAITALFGKAGKDGETDLQRGALMFWDVIPQVEGDALQVEVMTPHQSHYYQNRDTPHESGQPNPINFLTVPPGSKFVFHVQCDVPFLQRLPQPAPEFARDGRWQQLLTAALSHAFQWLGFGGKTAVGYGAMREDDAARKRRAQQDEARRAQAAEQERQQRLSQMSPEQREAEATRVWLNAFRAQLDSERKRGTYKAGSAFDQSRAEVLRHALALQSEALRREAAQALRESYKFTAWPGNKERKQEVKQWLTQLDGQA